MKEEYNSNNNKNTVKSLFKFSISLIQSTSVHMLKKRKKMHEKLKISTRIFQNLFFLLLLLRSTVSAQIDWAEDDDDPGKPKFSSTLINNSTIKVIYIIKQLRFQKLKLFTYDLINSYFPSLVLMKHTCDIIGVFLHFNYFNNY